MERKSAGLARGMPTGKIKGKSKEIPIFRLYSHDKAGYGCGCYDTLQRTELLIRKQPVGDFRLHSGILQVWWAIIGNRPTGRSLIEDLLMMTSGLTYGDNDTVPELAARKLLSEVEEGLKDERPMTTLEFAERAGRDPAAVPARDLLEIWDFRGIFRSGH